MYQLALTTHITGIVILAGLIFADFFISLFFWKFYKEENQQLPAIASLQERLLKILGFGGLITILAGIWLILINPGWTSMIWFHIKMGLLIILIFNAVVLRRRMNKKLNAIAGGSLDRTHSLLLKNKLTALQVTQIMILLTMFTLSVFKFG